MGIIQKVIVRRNRPRRLKRAALRTLRVACGFTTIWLGAACTGFGAPKPDHQPSLESLLDRTNLLTSAFVQNRHIQIVCGNDAQWWRSFKATWEHSRAPAQGFHYSSATLQAGKPASSMPAPPSHWRRVKVLSKTESERFLYAAANLVVPIEPGHGIFCRYAFGDMVLFRDPSGQVQHVAAEEKPADVSIERRYARQELAATIAALLATNLSSLYPNENAFLLTLGSGSRFRLAFLNLKERSVVVLYLPESSEEPPIAHVGLKLSNVASFIVVDNVWTFLKNPVSASGRTLNQAIEWTMTLFNPRLRENRQPAPPLTQGPGMDLAAWEQWLDRHTHNPRELGSMRLLIDGDQFYPVIERRFAEARTSIDVHVCIFDSDDVAVDLADQLKERSTNVQVKVIYDRLLSRGASETPSATPMREGFTPPRSIGKYLSHDSKVRVRPQPNPGFTADHSKIFVVDSRYAYVGGMNLGREYRYEWHDLMAEIQGPIVASFSGQFNKKWGQVGLWGDCALGIEELRGKPGSVAPEPGARLMELRRLYTRTFDRQIRRAQLAAINRAANHVFAENPYFFSNDMLIALTGARARGVDVRVVMPSENDLGSGHRSNLVIANYLLEHGVRVYFYPGMTHVKALQVDGWACFGSANFDALSLRLNREADVATSDPVFASQFRRELFETDFARSRELKEPLAVGWGDYLADAMLAPF